MISRRAFLASLTGSLLAAPLAAKAQQAGKVYRIGILFFGSPANTIEAQEAFRDGLRDLGYIEVGTSVSNGASPRAGSIALPSSQPTWSA